jgi:hypothetical protein
VLAAAIRGDRARTWRIDCKGENDVGRLRASDRQSAQGMPELGLGVGSMRNGPICGARTIGVALL